MEHPFLDSTFCIPWSRLQPSSIEPDIQEALRRAEAAIEKIAAQDPQKADFNSSFIALGEATEPLRLAWGKVAHLDSVCNNEQLRTVYNALLPKVSSFFTRIALNQRLWEVLKQVASSTQDSTLTPAQRRLRDETIADFRESGADLDVADKKKLEEINKELAKLTQQYSENVLDSTNAWELILEEHQLQGLPESARAAALQSAQDKGIGDASNRKYRFTLHAPSMIPILRYLDDAAIRKQVWEASSTIGYNGQWDNTQLIRSILQLRQAKAHLLGHAHFADMVTQRRMAGSGKQALQFIEDLHRRVYPAFKQETAELEHFKAAQTQSAPAPLQPWEVAYWAEKRQLKEYDLDDEELRPYFPIDRVESGMFALAERLFGISIRKRTTCHLTSAEQKLPEDTIEVWHESVGYYDVYSGEKHIGSFYTDWFPRESKRGGAWMNYLYTGARNPGDSVPDPHLGLICGNLTPPIGDQPALLTHDDVQTIFHEFGHLLHHLLGEVEIKPLNGINVVWDFVELPSQIMENWCWERESLDFFARHYQTGEPIPDVLLNKMIRARNYMSASGFMRQLSLGKLDLELHIQPVDRLPEDLDTYLRELLAEYTARYQTEPPSIVRRFSHLFSSPTGYAAGYYSYKWAEVLDADAFTRFQQEGILNEETGRDFRCTILAKGNSEPAEKLFRDFMGRDPELEPLLRRSAIIR